MPEKLLKIFSLHCKVAYGTNHLSENSDVGKNWLIRMGYEKINEKELIVREFGYWSHFLETKPSLK